MLGLYISDLKSQIINYGKCKIDCFYTYDHYGI